VPLLFDLLPGGDEAGVPNSPQRRSAMFPATGPKRRLTANECWSASARNTAMERATAIAGQTRARQKLKMKTAGSAMR
jgi:hypothetical protein